MVSGFSSHYGNSFALVIGISEYLYLDYPPLMIENAEGEARALSYLLQSPPYNFQVQALVGREATRDRINDVLFGMRSAQSNDRLLVYFAGQGLTFQDSQGDERAALYAYDSARASTLRLEDVIDLRRYTQAKHVGFIFDTQLSGQAAGLTRSASSMGDFDSNMKRRAYQIMTAGDFVSVVSEPFSITSVLLRGLGPDGPLSEADYLSFTQLAEWVQQEAKRRYSVEYGHLTGSQGGEFIWAVAPEEEAGERVEPGAPRSRSAAPDLEAEAPSAGRGLFGGLLDKVEDIIAPEAEESLDEFADRDMPADVEPAPEPAEPASGAMPPPAPPAQKPAPAEEKKRKEEAKPDDDEREEEAIETVAIFVSYRRDDSACYAGRIYDRLAGRYGSGRVFMDINTIEPGQDFVDVIEGAVQACNVVLVLIGPEWLTIADSTGKRRLDNPEDFVRLEVKAGLDRTPDVRVIPLLLKGADMPGSNELPEALKSLSRRNALKITHERFHIDVDILIEAIDKIIGISLLESDIVAG